MFAKAIPSAPQGIGPTTGGSNSISSRMFVLGMIFVLLIPIIRIWPQIDTYIHPFRPELAASIFISGFLIWACFSAEARSFVERISRNEYLSILGPLLGFFLYALASIFWAGSSTSVLHHAGVWLCYILFYILARYYTDPLRGQVDFVVWGVAIFLCLICIPPVIEYYSVLAAGELPSLGLRYSKYTELANTAAPLIAAAYFYHSGRKALFAIACLVLIALFVVSTQSRSGIGLFYAGTVAVVLSVLLFSGLRQFRKKAVVLFCTILLTSVLSNVFLLAVIGKVPVVERVSDPSISDSTRLRPLLLRVSEEMFLSRPLTGIGADNFGQEYTHFQAKLAARDPNYPDLRLTEDQMPERAHNEFAQIGSELGIIGLALFTIFMLGIAYWGIFCLRQPDVSMYPVAAFIGAGVFLVSSCVTSYSFRTLQNGLMFFLVVAIAVGHSARRREQLRTQPLKSYAPYRTALAFGLLGCVALASISLIRAVAVEQIIEAGNRPDLASSEPLFAAAEATDPGNATIQAVIGRSLINYSKPAESIEHLRRAIDLGRATVTDYSYLATAQTLAGQEDAAIGTLDEGLRVYPLSIFLHSRIGSLLKDRGLQTESEAHFRRASEISPDQARMWRFFAESGGRIASQKSYQFDLPAVMDLKPTNAVYAMKDDRELRFPAEKLTIPH